MNKQNKILITGAAGFIGSYLVGFLNSKGYHQIILADEFDEEEKELNLHGKEYLVRVERDNLFEWLQKEDPGVQFVLHLGARTDTTEFDYRVHEKLNLEYSKQIWNYCTEKCLPVIYASSAATYGGGEFGYKDNHDEVDKLKPLNPYGISKNEFDKWALKQIYTPPDWAGLKFFNVYGPNEYHKGRMASVVFHSFNQIRAEGQVKLFRSHRPGFADGEQRRDFIYAEDIARVCFWIMEKMDAGQWGENILEGNGLYNLGTGQARSFNDLVNAIFGCLKLRSNITYIDTPADIRDKYQYFTEADMNKLRKAGYDQPFINLEEGVGDYVSRFLAGNKYY